MGSVLAVILLTLLLNLWANDGSVGDGNWPAWAVQHVIPLICVAAIVLFVALQSRDGVARRIAVRLSVITLLASLLNIVPFIFEDVTEYINFGPDRVQPSAFPAEASRTPSSAFQLFDMSRFRSRAAQEKQHAQYDAAVNTCMEEKRRQQPSQSDNTLKFECVSNASHVGPAAFIARYAQPNAPVVHTK